MIKLYHRHSESDYHSLKWEYDKMKNLCRSGVPAPEVYEIVQVGQQYGYIMERIDGATLGDFLQTKIQSLLSGDLSEQEFSCEVEEAVRKTAACLFEVHKSVLSKTQISGINSFEDQLKWHTENTPLLTDNEKLRIISMIDALPKKQSVCHGDPNPNNIIIGENGFRLIDWVNSGAGHFMYDIAEYVWVSTPRENELPKDFPESVKSFIQGKGDAISSAFLEEYKRISGEDVSDYHKWSIPLLAFKLGSSRTAEQKQELLKTIRSGLRGF
ncbi:MAG: aminoglycoside phosphotransferase family protein [Oscillospiraceae bacterium]